MSQTTLPPNHGTRLRETMGAVRVAFRWFGTRKQVSPDHRKRAAKTFDAESQYISMGKRIVDTKHASWKKMTGIRRRIVGEWKNATLPHPEVGVRLIKRDDIDAFTQRLDVLRNELKEAEQELNAHFDEIRLQAQQRLGDLYDESDYPRTLVGWFDVTWDFPSVDPPEYLQTINPSLYRQECERIQNQFTEAVHLAENAFLNEFSKLVAHLTDKLAGASDGKPKSLRDTAVTNLREFFERFQNMNIGSSEELDAMVEEAKRIVGNVTPDQLRDNETLRTQVSGQLQTLRSDLDGIMVDRPRRNLIRRPR